jgi:hypothetical protein
MSEERQQKIGDEQANIKRHWTHKRKFGINHFGAISRAHDTAGMQIAVEQRFGGVAEAVAQLQHTTLYGHITLHCNT